MGFKPSNMYCDVCDIRMRKVMVDEGTGRKIHVGFFCPRCEATWDWSQRLGTFVKEKPAKPLPKGMRHGTPEARGHGCECKRCELVDAPAPPPSHINTESAAFKKVMERFK